MPVLSTNNVHPIAQVTDLTNFPEVTQKVYLMNRLDL